MKEENDLPLPLVRLRAIILARYKNLHQFAHEAQVPYLNLWKTFNAKASIDWRFVQRVLDALRISEEEFMGASVIRVESEIEQLMREMQPESRSAVLHVARCCAKKAPNFPETSFETFEPCEPMDSDSLPGWCV